VARDLARDASSFVRPAWVRRPLPDGIRQVQLDQTRFSKSRVVDQEELAVRVLGRQLSEQPVGAIEGRLDAAQSGRESVVDRLAIVLAGRLGQHIPQHDAAVVALVDQVAGDEQNLVGRHLGVRKAMQHLRRDWVHVGLSPPPCSGKVTRG
jgi:hypothetical protein